MQYLLPRNTLLFLCLRIISLIPIQHQYLCIYCNYYSTYLLIPSFKYTDADNDA